MRMAESRHEGDSVRRKLLKSAAATMLALSAMAAMLFLAEFVSDATATAAAASTDDEPKPSSSFLGPRINGIIDVFYLYPSMCLGMLLRVVVATAIMINIDAFLKLVVTPALAATIVGAAATPLTFFVGQTLQPIVYSVCFLGFDDTFVMASLEATGVKKRLADAHLGGRWHDIQWFERFLTRYVIKVLAGWTVGIAGLATIIPIVGPVITAALAGWAVAWDMVYVPLSGMGRTGVFRQAATVVSNIGTFHWFGFWAVLIEEIPLLGPACHVYNVYSASFLLEALYLNETAANMVMNKDEL